MWGVQLCRPCLNKKWPLRKQLLTSFLSLAAVSLILALGVVMATTIIIGNKAESEARHSLEDQLKRHLKDASVEAAATIGERFRKLQYGVLDVTAFALRDALQENLILDGGGEGYPLSPAHVDLRDTQISDSSEATLVDFSRQAIPVDLGRSVWYYANDTSYTAEVPALDQPTIAKSARLDLLWPTMYKNSNETKAVYAAIPLAVSNRDVFRFFPGADLSDIPDVLFSCQDPEEEGCFDPQARPWYIDAVDADRSADTGLGEAIVTNPYNDAIGSPQSWLVTLARAVYSDDGDTPGNLLGVVGIDIRLDQIQQSVEDIVFLDSGYSILATAKEGTVLAAPSRVWDRDAATETTTVCALNNGMCSSEDDDGEGWEDLLAVTELGAYDFVSSASSSDDGDGEEGGEESILVAAPVTAIFDTDSGTGTVTHYILSAVPRDEIFETVYLMADLIQSSRNEILATTAFVAAATLVAVAVAVWFLAGRITRPIVKMTAAAESIARKGAETNVFGGVAAAWRGNDSGSGGGLGSSIRGAYAEGDDPSGNSRCARAVDYLLCRGDDEISALVHEFNLMFTGLGRRGSAAVGTGLEDTCVYPKNPFTTNFHTQPPSAPPAS